MKKNFATPEVGDEIYVDSTLNAGYGWPNVLGGLAKIKSITQTPTSINISVEEHPGYTYGWELLAPKQKDLQKEFGKKKACLV